MREWFDDLDPYKDEEEETEGYNPFKFNPWEEEEPEEDNPGRIEARAWRYEDDTKTDH